MPDGGFRWGAGAAGPLQQLNCNRNGPVLRAVFGFGPAFC